MTPTNRRRRRPSAQGTTGEASWGGAFAHALGGIGGAVPTVKVSPQPYYEAASNTLGLPALPPPGEIDATLLACLRAYLIHETAEYALTTWDKHPLVKANATTAPGFVSMVNGINDARIDTLYAGRYVGYRDALGVALAKDLAGFLAATSKPTAQYIAVALRYVGYGLLTWDEVPGSPAFLGRIKGIKDAHPRPNLGLTDPDHGQERVIQTAAAVYRALVGPLAGDEPQVPQDGEGQDGEGQKGEGEGEVEGQDGEGGGDAQGQDDEGPQGSSQEGQGEGEEGEEGQDTQGSSQGSQEGQGGSQEGRAQDGEGQDGSQGDGQTGEGGNGAGGAPSPLRPDEPLSKLEDDGTTIDTGDSITQQITSMTKGEGTTGGKLKVIPVAPCHDIVRVELTPGGRFSKLSRRRV